MPQLSGMVLRVWHRPEGMSNGLTVSIPAEVSAADPTGLPFTRADILAAVRISATEFQAASLFGSGWQGASVFAASLTCPVPLLTIDRCWQISFQLFDDVLTAARRYSVDAVMLAPALTAPVADRMFEPIESAWRACIQIERPLFGVRQKLAAMLVKCHRELKA